MVKISYSTHKGAVDKETTAMARGDNIRAHFKNTRETAMAIKGKTLPSALQYLEDVLNHKRCVPFRRFNGGPSRTPQAKEFKASQGRWPEKSVRVVIGLLKNLEANAEFKKLDTDAIVINHVSVQRAAKMRRRTFRAHGRINAYKRSPCHVELVGFVKKETVAKGSGMEVGRL
jgi:large subunit ribosomal protein L17e